MTQQPGTHTEHEDHGWSLVIPDHAARTESREYVASRKLMVALTGKAANLAAIYWPLDAAAAKSNPQLGQKS